MLFQFVRVLFHKYCKKVTVQYSSLLIGLFPGIHAVSCIMILFHSKIILPDTPPRQEPVFGVFSEFFEAEGAEPSIYDIS